MEQTVKAVTGKDWKLCPDCKSEFVQAIENGFRVEDISTDLMLCFNCKRLYIVFPDWYFKGKPRERKEYPKDISMEISDIISTKKAEMLKQYEINQAIYNTN